MYTRSSHSLSTVLLTRDAPSILRRRADPAVILARVGPRRRPVERTQIFEYRH